MVNKLGTLRNLFLAASAGLLASAAQAAPVSIDGVGFQVSYDDAALGALGAGPTGLLGNVLSLTPAGSPGLSAKSTFPSSTAAAASFSFTADPGYAIAGFSLAAGGSYYYFGAASVAASGSLDVDLGGSAASAALVPTGAFVSNSPFSFTTKEWSAQTEVAFAPVTAAEVDLSMLMQARAASGPNSSYISTASVDLGVMLVPAPLPNNSVPEPSTALLALAALGALKLRRRTA